MEVQPNEEIRVLLCDSHIIVVVERLYFHIKFDFCSSFKD